MKRDSSRGEIAGGALRSDGRARGRTRADAGQALAARDRSRGNRHSTASGRAGSCRTDALAEPTPVPVETIEREEPVPPMAAAVAVARCAPRTLAVLPRTIAAVPIDTRIPAATFALGSDKSPARSDTSPVGSDRSEESRVLAAAGILPLPAPAASDLAVRPAQSGVKAAEISVAASAPENILKTGLATPRGSRALPDGKRGPLSAQHPASRSAHGIGCARRDESPPRGLARSAFGSGAARTGTEFCMARAVAHQGRHASGARNSARVGRGVHTDLSQRR